MNDCVHLNVENVISRRHHPGRILTTLHESSIYKRNLSSNNYFYTPLKLRYAVK